MDTWTLQTGFPVVTVKRNYGNNSLTITQERFIYENGMLNGVKSPRSNCTWFVPISFTSQSSQEFYKTAPSHWMLNTSQIVIEDLNIDPDDWLIFNMQQTGIANSQNICIVPTFLKCVPKCLSIL